MEKVDLVIVGAAGVVESGGIINKVSCMGLCHHHSSTVVDTITTPDWHLPNSCDGQSIEQTILRGSGEL